MQRSLKAHKPVERIWVQLEHQSLSAKGGCAVLDRETKQSNTRLDFLKDIGNSKRQRYP